MPYVKGTNLIMIPKMLFPFQHSLTKHIDIIYHFFKYNILKGNIEIIFVPIIEEIAYVFTKALDPTTFNNFLIILGIINVDPNMLT